jgi:mono/diheme cytochrome c family protein
MRSFSLMCAGLLLASWNSTGYAQSRTRPGVQTGLGHAYTPADGKGLFTTFCIGCHGENGKGDGPTARWLKTSPADLTQLTRNNKGVFPDARVLNILKGDVILNAHGTQEMPTWGPPLRHLDGDPIAGLKRMYSLVLYIAELQPSADAASGKELYNSLCARCHGENGIGNGPVASTLKTLPPDLTRLTRRNNGLFPHERVLHIIKGDVVLKTRGTQEMPTWGPTLRQMDSDPAAGDARIDTLVEYLAKLQVR